MLRIIFFVFCFLFGSGVVFSQDGTFDATFNVGSGANFEVRAIAVQPDGKILVGGGFTTFNGVAKNRLVRLLPNGNLDNTFNTGAGPSGIVNKIQVLPSGKIFIAGNISEYNGVDCKFLVKLNSDGTRDTSFNTMDNTNILSPARDFFILPDEKILLAGTLTNFNNSGFKGLIKLNNDGSMDTSFNHGDGFNTSGYVNAVDVQSDGKIIVGGNFTQYHNQIKYHLVRLNTDGSLDNTFNAGGNGPGGEVRSLKVLADDKILVAGNIGSYNGFSTYDFVCLNSDGTRDVNFYIDSTNLVSLANQILVQPDNKILLVGSYSAINGSPPRSLVRRNSDGTIDTTFQMGTGPNAASFACALQNDGKILLGGNFTSYAGISINRIARLNGGSYLGLNDDLYLEKKIKIYPNPSSALLSISIMSGILIDKVEIYSFKGEKIKEINGFFEQIRIVDLTPGVYFVKVYSEKIIYDAKFIKK